MPCVIIPGAYLHNSCGYSINHSINDTDHNSLSGADSISETFKSGFKPTKAAFLEPKWLLCTFRILIFVLFLVIAGLIEWWSPLSQRQQKRR